MPGARLARLCRRRASSPFLSVGLALLLLGLAPYIFSSYFLVLAHPAPSRTSH